MVEITRKRGSPVTAPPHGPPVLLHPREDDPFDFMTLDIVGDTFLFVPASDEGTREHYRAEYTISVLGLNDRDYLPVARREAYHSYRARLREYVADVEAGAGLVVLRRRIDALKRMQHPTVWKEMRKQRSYIKELDKLFRSASEALEW